MAAALNKVLLMGNLTSDPALRYTPGGAAVCELRMAINRSFMGSNGQQRDEVCFVDVTVWGKSAELCPRYLGKGSPVFVEGRLQLDQWEDRESGKKMSKLRVVADNVQFLSGGGQQRRGEMDQDAPEGYQQSGGYQQSNPGYQQAPQQQQPPRQFQQRPPQGAAGNGPLQYQRGPAAQPNQAPAMPPLPEDPYVAGAEDDIPF